jgi:glycosyltransferase involved in cell wall biosynthesis
LTAPVVSVITPFYNVAPYLEECIRSVLGQTFGDFEYLLVNNQSTDGSREIAAALAATDPRIRLIDNPRFVGQVENYNGALAHADGGARYVKIVQADDALLPDCLRLMVEVANQNERIGIVASYYLEGSTIMGSGVPYGVTHVAGREMGRSMLLDNCFVLGSPTSVMYRASVVRSRTPFYALGRLHEDTEAGFEILLQHDLGFVHQILSFLRTDNISIMSAIRRFNPTPLDHLIVLDRFGPELLAAEEFTKQWDAEWRAYLGFLGLSALAQRSEEFWAYHRRGLATIGRSLRRRDLILPALRQATRLVANPIGLFEGRWKELLRMRGD